MKEIKVHNMRYLCYQFLTTFINMNTLILQVLLLSINLAMSKSIKRSNKVLLNDTLLIESDGKISFKTVIELAQKSQPNQHPRRNVNISVNQDNFDQNINCIAKCQQIEGNNSRRLSPDYPKRSNTFDHIDNKSTNLANSQSRYQEGEGDQGRDHNMYLPRIESSLQSEDYHYNTDKEYIEVTESDHENERNFEKEHQEYNKYKQEKQMEYSTIRSELRKIDRQMKNLALHRSRLKYFLSISKEGYEANLEENIPMKDCQCCGKMIRKRCFRCEHLYCNINNCQRRKRQMLNERRLDKMKANQVDFIDKMKNVTIEKIAEYALPQPIIGQPLPSNNKSINISTPSNVSSFRHSILVSDSEEDEYSVQTL